MKKLLSIVIPAYNEEGNIINLYSEIIESLERDFKDFDYEIIFVNDGSTDKTWDEINECKKRNNKVIWINLNRNYGQAIALQVWFDEAKGDLIFSLDGDWQNDPKDFIRLYNKLIEEKLDVVAWWRKKRKDPNWMLVITKSARFLRWLLIKDWVHDSWCTLRIYKKEVIKNLNLWGEMHRYIIALCKINWYKIWEIVVNHRPRTIWTSKYNWKKSFKWLIDLIYIWFISKYQWRPLHLFWFLGLVNFFIGWFMILWALLKKIAYNIDISNSWFFIMWIFLFEIGLLLFLFGIIIDLLIRININTDEKVKKYIIRDRI